LGGRVGVVGMVYICIGMVYVRGGGDVYGWVSGCEWVGVWVGGGVVSKVA